MRIAGREAREAEEQAGERGATINTNENRKEGEQNPAEGVEMFKIVGVFTDAEEIAEGVRIIWTGKGLEFIAVLVNDRPEWVEVMTKSGTAYEVPPEGWAGIVADEYGRQDAEEIARGDVKAGAPGFLG